MEKRFFRECINKEVYSGYKNGKLSLFDKIWCKYFRPETNSVFLIRSYLFHYSRRGAHKLVAKYRYVQLQRRYGIFVSAGAKIGIGLRIAHPIGICIAGCQIGENLTIYQNCTIGMKHNNLKDNENHSVPIIGNNVTMYANSQIIGDVEVHDNCVIAAGAVCVKNTTAAGIYAGIPAKLLKEACLG